MAARVAIVGGGVTGSACAYALREEVLSGRHASIQPSSHTRTPNPAARREVFSSRAPPLPPIAAATAACRLPLAASAAAAS